MSAFDELTLAELDEITAGPLRGKSFTDPDVDQFALAGGVMWVTKRKTNGNPNLSWDEFRTSTKIADIKVFAEQMEREENPTKVPKESTSLENVLTSGTTGI